MPDNDRREAAFRAGKLDVIYGVGSPGWLEKMEKEPHAVVDVFGSGFTGMFHFNTSVPPLDDIRVRKALVAAMDRTALTEASSRRLVRPVYSPMSAAFLPGGLLNDAVVFPLFDINQMTVRRAYVDYGHPLRSSLSDYPQFNEKTRLVLPNP